MAPDHHPSTRRRFLLLVLAAMAAFVCLLAIDVRLTPRIHGVQLLSRAGNSSPGTFPFSIPLRPGELAMLRFAITATKSTGNRIQLQTDTCINSLSINGHRIPTTCTGTSNTIDLGVKLSNGTNQVFLTLQSPSARSVSLTILHPPGNVQLFARTAAMALLLICGIALWHFLTGRNWTTTGVVGLGGFLRLLYVIATPVVSRGYDAKEHMEYVRYLAEHFRFPPSTGGWEFHQPPLYYLLNAPAMLLSRTMHLPDSTGTFWMQAISFALSLLALGLACGIGLALKKHFNRRESLLLYCGLVAVFPGLVMVAARINNDALAVSTGLLAILLLVRFHERPTLVGVALTSGAIALGLLTKLHAILLVPVLWFSILFAPRIPRITRLQWIYVSIGCIAILAGWFFAYRLQRGELTEMFRFGGGQNHLLTVPNTPRAFFRFNPVMALQIPYVSPWNDAGGRQWFWLYFFKTSLFGEFTYPAALAGASRMLILSGISLLPWIYAALFLRRPDDRRLHALLLFLFLVLLGAAIAYRARHPMASNQDFRHSLLLVPCAFALLSLFTDSLSPFLRNTVLLCSEVFIISSAAFFVLLAVHS